VYPISNGTVFLTECRVCMVYVINTPQQREIGQPTQSFPMVVDPYAVGHDMMLYRWIANSGNSAWPL